MLSGTLLKLNFHIHSGGNVKLAQGVNCLLSRFQNIEQPLMSANLELVAGFLVNVR
jgi:hypothetical protein